jgi:hypothetical protein
VIGWLAFMITRIISGGQTGVDRAALDVALEYSIDCGGWCPRGRRAEDGPIPERYPLQDTPWDGYPQRTEWNIRDADGTLILTRGEPDRGTALTERLAKEKKKPCLVVELAKPWDVEAARRWIEDNKIVTLNVAGPRESSSPGIGEEARHYLQHLLGTKD